MKKKSSAQLDREIAEALAKPSVHAAKKADHPSGLDWSDLAPTGIRVQAHSGDLPLEDATADEIRREMDRRLSGYRAVVHVPGRRKKWSLAIHELVEAKPWTKRHVPKDVWAVVVSDVGGGAAHATRKSPAAEKKRQVKELQHERERIFQAMGYAGNTAEQVRRYHGMIAEIDAKMRMLK